MLPHLFSCGVARATAGAQWNRLPRMAPLWSGSPMWRSSSAPWGPNRPRPSSSRLGLALLTAFSIPHGSEPWIPSPPLPPCSYARTRYLDGLENPADRQNCSRHQPFPERQATRRACNNCHSPLRANHMFPRQGQDENRFDSKMQQHDEPLLSIWRRTTAWQP